MRCEICGKKVEKPVKTKIESSVMLTCNECSKFGKVQREPPKARKPGPVKRSPRFREPSEEVLEDYNIIIRESREKKGWTREELAEKIYEKASVINRIESGKMVPDIKLARKLERTLDVKLIEKIENGKPEDSGPATRRGATIGDIARIKRN
jgi:putative transcription factor